MSHLTIPADPVEAEYSVGSTPSDGPFTIPFAFLEEDHVKVSIDGVEQTIVTDYTVVGTAADSGGYSGGTLTLVDTVSNAIVKVYRDTDIDRLANFPEAGPFDIQQLNNEQNKVIAILQEQENQRSNYLQVPDSSNSTAPLDAGGRALTNLGEDTADASAVTQRELLASGPNGAINDGLETGPYTVDAWNTLITLSAIEIQGAETDTTKLFDLLTQYFGFVQNRNSLEAEVYFRYRYIVDCYSEITLEANSAYRVKIPATSALPISFMHLAEDVDYFNGDGTVTVHIDMYPLGVASANVWTQWNNLVVNTSQPR